MIGLNRHLVKVVDHNPQWISLAAGECQELKFVCNQLLVDVQHVGSTAIPDLPAKPILDLAAAVDSFDIMPEMIQILRETGYLYCGVLKEILETNKNTVQEDSHLFVKESSPDVRTIHLHIVIYQGIEWENYIFFRDVLLHDPRVRKQYAKLKLDLHNSCQNDRKSYTSYKNDFIQEVLNKK